MSTVDVKPDEVSAILRQQLSNFKNMQPNLKKLGYSIAVGDGIARIYGLTQAAAGELVQFEGA